MRALVLAVALVLTSSFADAVTLRSSLPTRVPVPRGGLSHHRDRPPSRVRAVKRPRAAPPSRAERRTVVPSAIHVWDGDTFYVGEDTIRLRGIDAPELGQPRAYDARRRLIQLLHAGPVTIVRHAEDVYGRIVADVYAGGRNVADVLRAEGFAKPRPPTSVGSSRAAACPVVRARC